MVSRSRYAAPMSVFWNIHWPLPGLELLALGSLHQPLDGNSAIVRRVASPGLYGSGPVEFVTSGGYSGFFGNAQAVARAELRCVRFPWLRLGTDDLPLPDGWTRAAQVVWTARQVSVTQGQHGPLTFSSLTRFRFCP